MEIHVNVAVVVDWYTNFLVGLIGSGDINAIVSLLGGFVDSRFIDRCDFKATR